MGYYQAGFQEIVGVDINPQPRYPFAFVQTDALEYVAEHGNEFDAIHASPPCQQYSTIAPNKGDYPDLYAPIRELLLSSSVPWIIENVIGAPYGYGFVLCGSMFNLVVRRHRNFETSWLHLMGLRCDHRKQGRAITITGHAGNKPTSHSNKGIHALWPEYMGMPWATPEECTQAIPPMYTKYIGQELLSFA
jgi:DNA (cytosine-5)-methyltransferase 1